MLITSEIIKDAGSMSEFLDNRPILEVFVDMDGVVCDWYNDACQLMGVDPDDVKWEGDEEALRQLVDSEDLYDAINDGFDYFFSDMTPYDHTAELMDLTEKADGIILTAPMRHCPGCYSGKVEWLNNYWPDTDRFIITKRKEACAKPTALLIDDRPSNCEAFVAAGGNAIVFPSLSFDGTLTIDEILELMREMASRRSPNIST